jgi:hypothetical protein
VRLSLRLFYSRAVNKYSTCVRLVPFLHLEFGFLGDDFYSCCEVFGELTVEESGYGIWTQRIEKGCLVYVLLGSRDPEMHSS